MWNKRCGASFLRDACGAAAGETRSFPFLRVVGTFSVKCQMYFAQKIQYIVFVFKHLIVIIMYFKINQTQKDRYCIIPLK